ncbi:MAG: hypothetical protein NTW45_04825 [Rhodocyclales bacterium]|nr:hypothetical protein [Rhodocyclales bacterium]
MSKIVQAVNAMIANPQLITNVVRGEHEFFFLYKNRYTWSMTKREDDYLLWFYPGCSDPNSLTSVEGPEWEGVPMVTYRANEIGTREAKASFSELYTIIKERLYGLNDVLDDIIADVDHL